MKKILLSAFALCLFTGATHAAEIEKDVNNKNLHEGEKSSKDDPDYPCVFTITIKDPKGGVVSKKEITSTTYNSDDCCSFADYKVAQVTKELKLGFTATHNL